MCAQGERMSSPGFNDNALGLTIRVAAPLALVYAAYLVAMCPCDTMLACESHGTTYFALVGFAILSVAIHMEYGHK